MYRCLQCHTPLTNLDIAFSRYLVPDQKTTDCSCVNCQIGADSANDLKHFHPVTPSSIIFHLLPYVLAAINGICFGVFHLTFDNPVTILLLITTVVFGILVCPIAVLKPMYKTWDIYEDGYLKGTIKPNNVLEIEKVPGGYVSHSNGFVLFLASWFFPTWSVFHLIYLLLKQRKIKKKHPAHVVDAYIFAYKSARRIQKK